VERDGTKFVPDVKHPAAIIDQSDQRGWISEGLIYAGKLIPSKLLRISFLFTRSKFRWE
jgi:hypothetical protein